MTAVGLAPAGTCHADLPHSDRPFQPRLLVGREQPAFLDIVWIESYQTISLLTAYDNFPECCLRYPGLVHGESTGSRVPIFCPPFRVAYDYVQTEIQSV